MLYYCLDLVELRVCDMLKAELMSHKHLQKRVVLVAEVLDHPGMYNHHIQFSKRTYFQLFILRVFPR